MYACLYRLPTPEPSAGGARTLVSIAQDFSPRYERHRDDLVSIDVRGLSRLLGPARAIGKELASAAAARGLHVRVALAGTQMAALVLAQSRPGLTVVEPDAHRQTIAPLPIDILGRLFGGAGPDARGIDAVLSTLRAWGIGTLGAFAALPPADVAARLGQGALFWQAVARGDDVRPMVPTVADERFEGTLELEWPIEGREPLSFVLTRVLEPISLRLERRDRGAAVVYVELRLVTRETCVRRLELPSPMRDVRTLRTLLLLALEAHPPEGAIDRVTVVIEPTPARVLQHTLFTRAHPTPEQLSTLLARLGALMGQGRLGAPAPVDSHRPGAFALRPFSTVHETGAPSVAPRGTTAPAVDAPPGRPLATAVRRYRQPVPARVLLHGGDDTRPARVTTDRRGFAGGAVVACAGPWRASGDWWAPTRYARDEWDVALSDGAVYRIYRDDTGGWFIDAMAD